MIILISHSPCPPAECLLIALPTLLYVVLTCAICQAFSRKRALHSPSSYYIRGVENRHCMKNNVILFAIKKQQESTLCVQCRVTYPFMKTYFKSGSFLPAMLHPRIRGTALSLTKMFPNNVKNKSPEITYSKILQATVRNQQYHIILLRTARE